MNELCIQEELMANIFKLGDVMVTALLDLTQGPQCNQTNAASSHSMNGILQTFQTLNSIQYIKGFKIGNKSTLIVVLL